MRQSPFAFMRGSAAVMAADLAITPASGIWVQSCGDCHLANFGIVCGTGRLAGIRHHRFRRDAAGPVRMGSQAACSQLRGRCAQEPRHAGSGLPPSRAEHSGGVSPAHDEMMRLDPLSAWRSRVNVAEVLQNIEDAKLRERELKRLLAPSRRAPQGLSEAVGAAQEQLAHTSKAAAGSPVVRPG